MFKNDLRMYAAETNKDIMRFKHLSNNRTFSLKGVFVKNERGYRLNAKNKCF